MAATFTDLVGGLAEQKRRARLQGMPLTENEIRGTTAGYFDVASDRLARARALTQQKEFQEGQLALGRDTLGLQREQFAAELAAAKRAEEAERQSPFGQVVDPMGLFGFTKGPDALTKQKNAPYAAAAVPSTVTGLGAMSSKLCIIISACTSPDSYEVNLSRVFRDTFLGPVTLAGYYALARLVAPAINKVRAVRWLVYTGLVKRLVDYGEWILGLKSKRELALSETVAKGFLGLCTFLGRMKGR